MYVFRDNNSRKKKAKHGKDGKPELKVRLSGQPLTNEEQEWVERISALLESAGLKAQVKLHAKVDEKRIPEYFDITRTVHMRYEGPVTGEMFLSDTAVRPFGFMGMFVKLTERVGRNGSWQIIHKEILEEVTAENAKFYSRSRTRD